MLAKTSILQKKYTEKNIPKENTIYTLKRKTKAVYRQVPVHRYGARF